MSRLLRSPMFWILILAAGLRLAGLAWGLPAADGWDDDGFAPRNFLTALALTYKPGAYFTYPPLHALLLALPSLPVAGWALAHAPSLSQHDVIATITQPRFMTYFAVLGRLAGLAMSLGIIWTIGEMARLVAGRRAGLFAAGACALNFALTYYGQVSNLDVPYLFWGLLSLLWCMRAVTEQAPRRFWLAALFAAAAVATKDQAYALFLLSLPLFLLLWFVTDRWPRAHAGQVLKILLPAAIAALALLLLVDGAITNAGGFARRIAFLAGPASRDYAEYVPGRGVLLHARMLDGKKPILLGGLLKAYLAQRVPGGAANPELTALRAQAAARRVWPKTALMLQDNEAFFSLSGSAYLYGAITREPYSRADLKKTEPGCYQWLAGLFDGGRPRV